LERETLDVFETAQMLGVSQPSLRRSAAAGHLPTVAVPGVRRLLFSRQRIEALVHGDDAVPTEARRAEQQPVSAA